MPDEIEVVQAQLARVSVKDSEECGELMEVGDRSCRGRKESLIFIGGGAGFITAGLHWL